MHVPARLRFLVVLILGLALSAWGGLAGADTEADPKEVGKLIEQLGDEDMDVRKTAEKKLMDIGENVLEHLRKAVKEHSDPDVRLRAIVLMRTIERMNYGEIRQFTGHSGNIRHIAVSKDGKRAL